MTIQDALVIVDNIMQRVLIFFGSALLMMVCIVVWHRVRDRFRTFLEWMKSL